MKAVNRLLSDSVLSLAYFLEISPLFLAVELKFGSISQTRHAGVYSEMLFAIIIP